MMIAILFCFSFWLHDAPPQNFFSWDEKRQKKSSLHTTQTTKLDRFLFKKSIRQHFKNIVWPQDIIITKNFTFIMEAYFSKIPLLFALIYAMVQL